MADVHSGGGARPERPLSPHLQIYKPLINMVMSILHRITGAALYFGSVLLAWWLIAAATGPEYFNYVSSWFQAWPGKLVMIGYTWALLHHMTGGIRHFIWDTGRGYDLETIDRLSWGSIAVSLIATGLIWFAAATRQGGL
jgi:succinate dehydrogenase / fumarate reductase cytochrome b subunit